ncbi:uncharacterized protein L203_101303 [Cryptococcus depauperatus CBS 7841]|uniref:Uncharacterized protein n=1 Tax=Cryptococcus depauperatus CBS 7841 TaxID=1295531 RepID=A0A1E3IEP4_9TREE|nr:hypothetical protein L203_04339 [Cryptococcus depauperatus CBS 7841]
MSRAQTVADTLSSAINSLENDQNLRKQIKEASEPIEDLARLAWSEVNKVHSASSSQHQEICGNALGIIERIAPLWTNVAKLIPPGEFYRHISTIGPITRSLTTTLTLSRFLLLDELTPAFVVSNLIGLDQDGVKGMILLSSDDYLQGVIGTVNELPRLSINAVTSQNFDLPVKIAAFVNDIFASYSLLNLRNDGLRRRFDSLKYDLKRCEDVVYDLTLRGLAPTPKA